MVRQFVASDEQLSSKKDLDCAYIMLCRGVPFVQISTLSESMLQQCYQGFNKDNIEMIFNQQDVGQETNLSPPKRRNQPSPEEHSIES